MILRPRFSSSLCDLVDVEEAVLLEADVDERGVHAAEHVVDLGLVDVAQVRALVGPLDEDLGQPVVLDERHAQLAALAADEDALAARQLGAQRLGTRLRAAEPGARHRRIGGGVGRLVGGHRGLAVLAAMLATAATAAPRGRLRRRRSLCLAVRLGGCVLGVRRGRRAFRVEPLG